jgi:hypothetical protein
MAFPHSINLAFPERYDTFTNVDLDEWLSRSVFTSDVVLSVHDMNEYDAHTAIRHLSRLPLGESTVYLTLPFSLRKNRAFTPWLCNGRTIRRGVPLQASLMTPRACVMAFNAQQHHIHSAVSNSLHAASFDIRVGGMTVRALFDTGATCS